MRRVSAHFDAASEIRIVGAGHRSSALARGADDEGRRARREPAGRRVLRLPARGLRRGRDLVRRLPGGLPGPRGRRASACVRRRRGRRRLGRDERGLPDRDARHRRRRAPARRARDRVQPRHHPLHEEHALRREDGRHRPSRAREQLHRPRGRRTSRPSTGTWSRTCGCRAPGSSSTGSSSSRTAPGSSDPPRATE